MRQINPYSGLRATELDSTTFDDVATLQALGIFRRRLLFAGCATMIGCAFAVDLISSMHRAARVSATPTIRQLLESPELNHVIADNLISVGGIDQSERGALRQQVAQKVHQLGSVLRERHPETSEQLDSIVLTKEKKDSVMRVMRSFGDPRVKNVADDISEVVSEALSSGLGRERFKALVVARLQPRMAELRALRDEFFSQAGGGDAGSDWQQGMEKSRLMRSFDAWVTKVGQVSNQHSMRQGGVLARELGEEDGSAFGNVDRPIMNQLREFFHEIGDDVGQEYGEMKQELSNEFGPTAMRQAMRDRVAGVRHDIRDTFASMLEDIKETFSPSRARSRAHVKAGSIRDGILPSRNAPRAQSGFRSIFGSGNYGSASDQPEEGSDSDLSMMQCLANVLMLDPGSFMTCSMQAMTYCVDVIRSMFSP